MKLVSQLDQNGYFVGAVEAYESTLEPGIWLIPGGAVDVDPPVVPNGKRARWNNGWVFENMPEPEPEFEPYLPSTSSIPTIVTMRQARLALLQIGLLDDVEAAIASIPDETQRRAAQIEWEYASTVDRDSPWVQQLAVALGMDEAMLDELFSVAASL